MDENTIVLKQILKEPSDLFSQSYRNKYVIISLKNFVVNEIITIHICFRARISLNLTVQYCCHIPLIHNVPTLNIIVIYDIV